MSAALVESMASDFEPEHFTDDYQEQLRQLIEAKLDKGESLDTDETFGAPAEAGEGEVIDLMEALKRSLEKKRGGGGGAAETAAKTSGSAAKAAPKAAAKTTASKSTAAKSTATKTASTRAGSSKTAAASKATAAKTAQKGA